jgi:hypothetical protein
MRWPVAVLTLTLALIAAPAVGQNQPGSNQQTPSLPNSIKAASELSDQQQQQVQQFVQSGFGKLTAEQDSTVAAGRRQLVSPLSGAGSQTFRQFYGQQVASRLSGLMSQARPYVRLNALIVASNIQTPEVLTVAQASLQDQAPEVRYWAAMAVRNYARQSQEGLPEDQQEAVIQSLLNVINNEADPHVVKPAMLALAAIPGGNSNQRLLSALDQRIQVHLQNPEQSFIPEQDALQTLYRNLAVQVSENGASAYQQSIRNLARVAFRYKALVAQQQYQGGR